MKFLSLFLVFVFVFSSSTSAQEKKNPLEGTTWELISAKYEREDTTSTFPNSLYDQAIMIFGKTYFNFVKQDTSRDVNEGSSFTYNVDGDNLTVIFTMHPNYEGIGKTINWNYQIEGDQMILKATGIHIFGYDWKSFHQVWKRID